MPKYYVMAGAGYSKTPLVKKLGIREGFKMRLINEPGHYFDLLADIPHPIYNTSNKKGKKNFIHFFTKDLEELNKVLPGLKNEIEQDGIIWVSWPKKSAKTETDVSENLIRETGLACGLVDIKVCAIDETWSGLKFVIPVKDRQKP